MCHRIAETKQKITKGWEMTQIQSIKINTLNKYLNLNK